MPPPIVFYHSIIRPKCKPTDAEIHDKRMKEYLTEGRKKGCIFMKRTPQEALKIYVDSQKFS